MQWGVETILRRPTVLFLTSMSRDYHVPSPCWRCPSLVTAARHLKSLSRSFSCIRSPRSRSRLRAGLAMACRSAVAPKRLVNSYAAVAVLFGFIACVAAASFETKVRHGSACRKEAERATCRRQRPGRPASARWWQCKRLFLP